MSIKQANMFHHSKFSSSSGVAALLGDLLGEFNDVFATVPEKINLPNRRRPRTPEERALADLRRKLTMPAIDLVYHGHKVTMHGRHHALNEPISPYLLVAGFRIYTCTDGSGADSIKAYYQLWYQDIFIEDKLGQKQLIARLNVLYKLNKQRFTIGNDRSSSQ